MRSEIAYGENAEDYGETAREYAKRVADEIANNQSMKDVPAIGAIRSTCTLRVTRTGEDRLIPSLAPDEVPFSTLDTVPPQAIAHNLTEEHGITLLAGWSWGPSQCHAFAQLLQLKAGRNYTELSCNETRDNLQREFTEAYTALVDLYNKGVQQALDGSLGKNRAERLVDMFTVFVVGRFREKRKWSSSTVVALSRITTDAVI